MADILIQNSLKTLSKSLKLGNLGGISESDIKTAVAAAVANVTPLTTFVNTVDLQCLSSICNISHCLCNYAGSGTCGTLIGNSMWASLPGTDVFKDLSIYVRLMKTSQMSAIKKAIEAYDSELIKNDLMEYIELYAMEVIKGSSTTVKTLWLSGQTNRLKVCSANYNAGEGASCTWTVPAGVTKAKFQVWGAGAGSNPGCCCGGMSFGGNGAYSELFTCVTAGQQYVICAGCSCAVNNCSNTWPGYACMSGVTGPNICCLKADGAGYCTHYIHCYVRGYVGAGSQCCRFQNLYCTSSGPCFCSYGEYCYVSSCETCGIVAVYPDCVDRTYCACGCIAYQLCSGGYRPLHGGGCLDQSNYGYHTRPPTLDADTCKEYAGGCKCHKFCSECCSGGILGDSWDRHPGMGGASTHVMGGGNNHYGGKGAGGMVQVTWE